MSTTLLLWTCVGIAVCFFLWAIKSTWSYYVLHVVLRKAAEKKDKGIENPGSSEVVGIPPPPFDPNFDPKRFIRGLKKRHKKGGH